MISRCNCNSGCGSDRGFFSQGNCGCGNGCGSSSGSSNSCSSGYNNCGSDCNNSNSGCNNCGCGNNLFHCAAGGIANTIYRIVNGADKFFGGCC